MSCAHQELLVPGNDIERTAIGAFGVEGCAGRSGEVGKHDMGAAHAAHHGTPHLDAGTTAGAIDPGSGRVDDPGGFDFLFKVASPIPHEQTARAAVGHIDCHDLSVIADHGAGRYCLDQPLGDQALREFALRIFVIEDGPALPGIERALQFLARHLETGCIHVPPRHAAIDP